MLSVFLALAVLGTVAMAAPWNNTVVTTDGVVRGETIGDVIYFHSIPFASPPVGGLRFAPPTPPTPWSGVRDVSALPPLCPQIKILDLDILGSEDCLYLHVYVPRHDPDVVLPVMFWIYGGGYTFGDAYEFSIYDGTNLALNENVIVVAPNYRVGSFGFMALNELANEAGGTTGNYGLQDQQLALKWAQANVAKFGGDPNKITIFGESAGGFSVCWHLVSPGFAGLFSHAIMESGSCDSPQFFQSLDNAVAFNTEYAAGCGCQQTGDALVSCLRGLNTVDLMSCSINATSNLAQNRDAFLQYVTPGGVIPALWPFMPWGPAIDGSKLGLLDTPLALLTAGQFNKVPTIFGTNQNEGTIFVPAIILMVPGTNFPPQDADIEKALYRVFDMYPSANVAAVVPKVIAQYPAANYDGGWARASDLLTHYFFTCGVRRSARAIIDHGVPLWLYHFEYRFSFIEYDLLGDYHASELVFVWDNQFPPILHTFTSRDAAIADAFGLYWTNLGRFDSPNDPAVPVQWPQYSSSSNLNLNISYPIGTSANLLQPFCDFWDGIVKELAQ